MTAHVVANLDDVPCAVCNVWVGNNGHAWRDGWVCPDCCPRCELVGVLRFFALCFDNDKQLVALADAIADGALTDHDIADVMGVE